MIKNLHLLYMLQIIFVISYDKIKSRNEVNMSKEKRFVQVYEEECGFFGPESS